MSKAKLIAFTAVEFERYGIDLAENCKIVKKDASGPLGGFQVCWSHKGKSGKTWLPHDVSNPGELDIFRNTLKKQMREAGFEAIEEDIDQVEMDELKARLERLEKRYKELDANQRVLAGDVRTASDLTLEKAAQVENVIGLLQGLMAAKPSVTEPKVLLRQPEPEYPKMAVAPVLAKPDPTKDNKGLAALEQVKRQKWAEVVTKIHGKNSEFEIDDFEGHILFFLHECGPHSAHDLRVSGVWKSTDSVTYYLENMEAKRLVKYMPVEKLWGITNDGIAALRYEEDEPAEAIAPVPLPPALTPIYAPEMPSTPRVLAPVELKPVIVELKPKAPKILAPVPSMDELYKGLPPKDALLVYLLVNGPKTTGDLRASGKLVGYGVENDFGSLTYMTKLAGFITNEKKGAPWRLTRIGQERTERLMRNAAAPDLRRQFGK